MVLDGILPLSASHLYTIFRDSANARICAWFAWLASCYFSPVRTVSGYCSLPTLPDNRAVRALIGNWTKEGLTRLAGSADYCRRHWSWSRIHESTVKRSRVAEKGS